MPESALQTVFQATIMAKVLCVTSAWWSFTSASDRQRIAAFVGRAKRSGLCQADQPPVTQLVKDADDKLFQSVLHNPEHTLHQLLPHRRHNITYYLRPRRHDITLVVDHIAFSIADNYLRTSIDYFSYLAYIYITVFKLRPDSFLIK